MRRSPLLYAIITVLWLVIAIIRFSDGFTWSGLVAVIGSVLFFALAIYHFLKNRSGAKSHPEHKTARPGWDAPFGV